MFLVIKVFPDMRLPPLSSLIGFVSFIIFSRGSHPYTPPLSGLSFPERCQAPVGVNVPDDTMLISLLNEAPLEILTLISTLWPLLGGRKG